jgi:hypothetical protein
MPTNYTIKPSSSTRESASHARGTICSLMFEFPNLSACVDGVNQYHPPYTPAELSFMPTDYMYKSARTFACFGRFESRSARRPRPRSVSYCEKISATDGRKPKSLLMLLPCAHTPIPRGCLDEIETWEVYGGAGLAASVPASRSGLGWIFPRRRPLMGFCKIRRQRIAFIEFWLCAYGRPNWVSYQICFIKLSYLTLCVGCHERCRTAIWFWSSHLSAVEIFQ